MRRWLMFAALAYLWSTWVQPVYADELVGSLSWYGGFAAGDLASTAFALQNGAHEANPIMRREGVRYALKAGQVAGLVWLDRKLAKRDRKLQWACRLLYAGANAAAAIHNIRQGRR